MSVDPFGYLLVMGYGDFKTRYVYIALYQGV